MLLVQPHDLKYLERKKFSKRPLFSPLLSFFFYFSKPTSLSRANGDDVGITLVTASFDPFLPCPARRPRDSSLKAVAGIPPKQNTTAARVRVRVKTMLTPLLLATWSSVALQASVALTFSLLSKNNYKVASNII